eukprot:gene19412-26069_t
MGKMGLEKRKKQKVVIAIVTTVSSLLSVLVVYARRDAWKDSMRQIWPSFGNKREIEPEPEKPAYRARTAIVILTTVVRGMLVAALATLLAIHKDWYAFSLLGALTALIGVAEYHIYRYKACQTLKKQAIKQVKKVPAHEVDKRLTGEWIKVEKLSESMAPAIAVLQLNGLAKQAVKLFKGVGISVDHGYLEITAFSLIPFLQVSLMPDALYLMPSA